jgi:hypothetical protein
VQACQEVAEASGGLARVVDIGSGVSGEEEALLEAITTTLRGPRELKKNTRADPTAS